MLLCFLFDDMKWCKLEMSGISPSPRRWHTLTQIPNYKNKYLVFGGYDGNKSNLLKDLHELDLERQYWMEPSQKGLKPFGRARHSMIPMGDKQMLIFGGKGENSREIFVLHLDDMSWNRLERVGEVYPAIRIAHRAVKISEHGIVIGGGYCGNYVEPFYYMDMRMFKL